MPFPVSAEELEGFRAHYLPDVCGAVRLAAERAFHFFDKCRPGWAEHIEPTIELIEVGYFECLQRAMRSKGDHSSGIAFLMVHKTAEQIVFSLDLATIVTFPGEAPCCLDTRYLAEGGLGDAVEVSDIDNEWAD